MRRLVYLDAAIRDLSGIHDYLSEASGSPVIARGFTQSMRDQCRRLAALPGTLGRARPELLPDIRSFPFQGYMIFFRYTDSAVIIVNVLEGHRDIDPHFGA